MKKITPGEVSLEDFARLCMNIDLADLEKRILAFKINRYNRTKELHKKLFEVGKHNDFIETCKKISSMTVTGRITTWKPELQQLTGRNFRPSMMIIDDPLSRPTEEEFKRLYSTDLECPKDEVEQHKPMANRPHGWYQQQFARGKRNESK